MSDDTLARHQRANKEKLARLLKEVGEWMSRPCPHRKEDGKLGMRRDCFICLNLLIEATDKGNLPGEV